MSLQEDTLLDISNVFSSRPLRTHFASRSFPAHVSACPPLRSFPGVILRTSAIWEEIADLAQVLTVPKGEILYPLEDELPPLIYVKSGKVRINFIDIEGNERVLHFSLPGSTIWDGFYAADLHFRPMPVKAVEKCVLYLFDSRMSIEHLFQINPLLIRNLLYSQAVKNITHSRLAMINSHRKPLSRVALFLHEMREAMGRDSFPGLISQAEMATLLHLHRVTISNALTTLKNLDILRSFNRQEVSFHSPEKLLPLAVDSANTP